MPLSLKSIKIIAKGGIVLAQIIEITPIGKVCTDFGSKFGIPRQSGLIEELKGKIVFEKEYRRSEAFRGLEDFSHIWVLWQFSENADKQWSPTVRPPRLGGNRRVGVFASRSPFRPNSIGISCVRLDKIETDTTDGPVLYVSGVDMLDGTPVIDIKPYIPLADSKPEATEGYTADTKKYTANVKYINGTDKKFPEDRLGLLTEILGNDPRPSYKNVAEESYGINFAGYNIIFTAKGTDITVTEIEKGEFNGTSD